MSDIQKWAYPAPVTKLYFIPGTPYYERLLKENPRKLKRLMKEEQERFQQTHALDWPETNDRIMKEAHVRNEQRRKLSDDGKLLGLDTSTDPITKRDVKNAYRRKARKLHPDAGGSDEAFKQLHEAYRRILAVTKPD